MSRTLFSGIRAPSSASWSISARFGRIAMSGGSPACRWAVRARVMSFVPCQSTMAPDAFSQADATAWKLSSSGPLHRPRTWTWAPAMLSESVLVATAETDAVAEALAVGADDPSEREHPAARMAPSRTMPTIRVACGRWVTVTAYRPETRPGPMSRDPAHGLTLNDPGTRRGDDDEADRID